VFGDLLLSSGWAVGKEFSYAVGECMNVLLVLFCASFLFAPSSPFSNFNVGQTLRLSLL
jgi:hypothetical protein